MLSSKTSPETSISIAAPARPRLPSKSYTLPAGQPVPIVSPALSSKPTGTSFSDSKPPCNKPRFQTCHFRPSQGLDHPSNSLPLPPTITHPKPDFSTPPNIEVLLALPPCPKTHRFELERIRVCEQAVVGDEEISEGDRKEELDRVKEVWKRIEKSLSF